MLRHESCLLGEHVADHDEGNDADCDGNDGEGVDDDGGICFRQLADHDEVHCCKQAGNDGHDRPLHPHREGVTRFPFTEKKAGTRDEGNTDECDDQDEGLKETALFFQQQPGKDDDEHGC